MITMPTSIRLLVVLLVTIGVGSIVWGVGGLAQLATPLIQYGDVVYMDARGAIGIGAGALAGAATAVLLFRDLGAAPGLRKHLVDPDDLT
jgi:hypothetical protein